MKKMGIAVLAGAFVLVSVGAGHAGPNVGGRNFNIQARSVASNVVRARKALYARNGTPRTVSNWHWERADLGWRSYKTNTPPVVLKRVPAR